jgi:hypothetical protein
MLLLNFNTVVLLQCFQCIVNIDTILLVELLYTRIHSVTYIEYYTCIQLRPVLYVEFWRRRGKFFSVGQSDSSLIVGRIIDPRP